MLDAKKKCAEKKCKAGHVCKFKKCTKETGNKIECTSPKFWQNGKCTTCPQGTKRINGNCVKSQPAGCPPGMVKNAEGKCTIKTIIFVVTRCETGYKKVGKLCVKESPPSCDKGWTFNVKNGDCEKTVIEDVPCEKGYKREGDNCVKTIEECPKGFKKDPTNPKDCVKYVEDKCDPGYKKDSKGKCSKVVEIIVKEKCPSDYKWDAKTRKCTKKLGPGTCPQGHKWDAKLKKCTKVDHIKPAPEEKCPTGYKKTPKGDCTKTVIVLANCPKGYKVDKSGDCIKTVIIIKKDEEVVCPKGSKYNKKTKKCVSIVTKPAKCPKGTIRDAKTKKCKKTPPKVVKPKCNTAKGFVLKNGKCVKVTVRVSCEPGFKLNLKTKKCEKTKIIQKCGEGFKLNKKGKCEKIVVTKACPKGTTLKKDKCEKISCAKGFVLKGTKCIGRPEEDCPPGYSPDSKDKTQCSKTIVTVSCPKGFKLEKGECVKHIVKIECPPKFKYDKKSDSCIKEETKPTKCPKGMVRDGGDCVKQEDAGCPNGQVKDKQTGKCLACKEGETVRDGKCFKPKPPCADKPDTIFKNGKCVPRVPSCPKGKKLVKGKCVDPKPVSPPRPSCKKDEIYKDGKCVKRCSGEKLWDGVKCIEIWACYYKDQCVIRYEKYIREINLKITLLSTKLTTKKPTTKTPKVMPTKITKKPNTHSVKPTRETMNPNTHTIKPMRRSQAMVKKPVEKTPTSEIKIMIEIKVLRQKIVVYKKLMSQCADKKCPNGLVCGGNHKCVKPNKPKCKLSEIILRGKCIPKCKPGFVRRNRGGPCVKTVPTKCPAGTKVDPKTKKCIKVIQIIPSKNCPEGFIRNPKTKICEKKTPKKCKKDEKLVKGKCAKVEKTQECPQGYKKDKKSGDCITEKFTCPKGFTMKGLECIKEIITKTCPKGFTMKNNECIKVVAEFVCPKGFKLLYKGAKECFEINAKPVVKPFTGKDRTSCTMRFVIDIKKLTDQKEGLIDKWLNRDVSTAEKEKMRKSLDYINLQIAVMVGDVDECEKLPINQALKISSDLKTLKSTHMCGAIPCTKAVHDKFINRFQLYVTVTKKVYKERQQRSQKFSNTVEAQEAESAKAWKEWKAKFKSQNKLALTVMDMKIAKVNAERALAANKSEANQKALGAVTEKLNTANSELENSVDGATKFLKIAIDKKVKAKKTQERWLDVEFSETKALDHAQDANKVVAMVAHFEKSLGAMAAENTKYFAVLKKSKDAKAKRTAG